MVERIFDPIGLGVLLGIVALSVLGAYVCARSIGAARWPLRAIEAGILTLLGGMLARIFIALLIAGGNDSPGACLAIGWGFFLVPGVVDTIPFIAGSGPILTSPDALLMFATVVGGGCGMMGGIWGIYKWLGLGLLAFPLDVTWALAGNTVGALLHLINFAWGDHEVPPDRDNVHRYAKGFGLRPGYAFTQGCVMSNLDRGPGDPLYRHERTHAWQNRGFGPLYTLTYLSWFAVWLIPSAIAGMIVQGFRGIWAGPNNWCYFNNPWETWAYAVQNAERTSIQGVAEADKKMIWPAKFVIAWAVPFFALATFLAIFTATQVFGQPSRAAVARSSSAIKAGHNSPAPAPKTAHGAAAHAQR